MRSVNKVILIGNLTRDPEVRQAPNGQTVCTFSIATNREWITSTGERKSDTQYHDLVAWARLGEICSQYLTKGKLIYIEGYLKTRSWETPENIRKHKTEIIIQDMIILEKRPKGDSLPLPPVVENEVEFTEEINVQESTPNPSAEPVQPINSESKPDIDINKDLGL